MGIIRNIRSRIGYAFLSGKFHPLNRRLEAINLFAARSVAVIFQPSDQDSFDQVRSFVKRLKEKDIAVTAIGFIDEKQIPNIYLLRKGYFFFCRSDLNWYLCPRGRFAQDFVMEEYDLLIDLCMERSLPVDCLSLLSRARFKAGKHFPGRELFDLSIDISKDNRQEFLIAQLEFYLDMINKPRTYETSHV